MGSVHSAAGPARSKRRTTVNKQPEHRGRYLAGRRYRHLWLNAEDTEGRGVYAVTDIADRLEFDGYSLGSQALPGCLKNLRVGRSPWHRGRGCLGTVGADKNENFTNPYLGAGWLLDTGHSRTAVLGPISVAKAANMTDRSRCTNDIQFCRRLSKNRVQKPFLCAFSPPLTVEDDRLDSQRVLIPELPSKVHRSQPDRQQRSTIKFPCSSPLLKRASSQNNITPLPTNAPARESSFRMEFGSVNPITRKGKTSGFSL